MRQAILTTLAVAASALALSACAPQTPPPAAAAVQPIGGMQTAPSRGGVTFQTGYGPGQVPPPPVTAYTGAQRGSNSPLGVTFPANPENAPPVTAYTGSQRGYSNSPLGFRRTYTGAPGDMPVEQPQVTPTQ